MNNISSILALRSQDYSTFNVYRSISPIIKVRDELRKETLQLARESLEKEQRILELRNQCTIIRTTEVAGAQDRLVDLERQKDDIMRSCCWPVSRG